MTGQVVHHPRVAWSAASVTARALSSDQVCGWLGQQFDRLFGPAYRVALFESRNRMRASQRPDAPEVECGLWRARLEDVLRNHPDLAGAVQDLVREASAVLERATDRQEFAPAPPPVRSGVIDLDRFR
jgi:hypothetical protein